MSLDIRVIGIKGDTPFDSIIDHFASLGGDAVLMNPLFICGKGQVISAVEHAERAFARGTNRSKTVLTEIILYAAGERQISKALEKMRPEPGCREYAVAVLGLSGDLHLDDIGMERDDGILSATEEKAKAMGLAEGFGIPYEDLAIEMVALLDLAKQ